MLDRRTNRLESPRRDPAPALLAEPSLGVALERVVDLSQQVVIDRIELLQVESQARLLAFLRRSIGLAIAVFTLLLAWAFLAVAAVAALEGRLPLEGALAVVAGAHVVMGCAVIAWARRSPESGR